MTEWLMEFSGMIAAFNAQVEVVAKQRHGWKSEAKRARLASLELEKMLKQFRRVTVDAEKTKK